MFAQENIYFTDCLLRHMHQHRFIAHYDPDEVPVVPKHRSYTHFLDELLKKYSDKKKTGRGSLPPAYQLTWRFFNDDIKPAGAAAQLPEYLWILRHIKRPKKDKKKMPGKYKCLYDMDVVRGVFSHGVLHCVTKNCKNRMKQIPLDYAYLGHFSKMCGEICNGNGTTTEEPTLHRYKDEVSREVKKVLEKLELMPKQTH